MSAEMKVFPPIVHVHISDEDMTLAYEQGRAFRQAVERMTKAQFKTVTRRSWRKK